MRGCLSLLCSDTQAAKLQSLGAEYARSLEEAQKADFIVVDLDFVKMHPSDNTDLYHLQPEWWRVYAPGLVTELLEGAQHEVRRK